MKNLIFKTTALTLIELIVSSMLVTIVLFGLFSITNVLSTNSQDYGQRYLLASQTQATLNHILNNVSLAVKDIGSGDTAIMYPVAADTNTFCIHQNVQCSSPVNGNPCTLSPASDTPLNTPGVYTNDRWLCYTMSAHQINYCSMAYVPGASPWGATQNCSGVANKTFLGTAYSITNPNPPALANGIFSMTVENCVDDSASSCNTIGTSTDLANNPEVARYGSIALKQIGS